ncbi:MAG TPA: N-acetylmuramoyl-L-alanine amidase [Ruminococcaceae bacterium]|nr:N-acetylmuramoyl-L-alanine amidase [Oscillospiraceae bacterium]
MEVTTMAKKVYVGIGHGGSDSGAVGNGFLEKDLTLSIGKYCNERLKQYGIETKISRTTDCDSSINSKVAASNAFKADVCMDIHINAGGGDGSEVYYSHVSPNGKKLAQSIVDATLAIRQNTRGIKTRIDDDGTDYFGMIRMTDAPAVLVECAFIDNATDIQIINTEAKRKVFGYAIADGVAKYLGVKLPTAKPTTPSKPTTAAVKIEAPNLGSYLKEGDRNLAVYSYKQLLALLKKKGIIAQGVDNNEIFGAGTKTATKQVQKAAGITVDGLAGPQTIRACYVLAAK